MSRHVWRWVLVLALVALLPGMVSARGAAAQDDTVEALALRVHLQNFRTYNYTDWVGGPLGDPLNSPGLEVAGTTLTDWSLDGLAGDVGIAAADLSRPTLLNFWASWCHPCQLEFPHLTQIALAPEDHAFDVLFVNVWDTLPEAEAYLTGYSPDLSTVLDTGDRLSGRIGVPSIPTSILLDQDGTVLVAHTGILTPTVTEFLDAVATDPGAGSFDPADYPEAVPQAELLPFDVGALDPITYGETVTGEITDEVTQRAYRFDGHAGETVRVTLEGRGSTLDPYLVVMAEDGTRLGEHDDINPGIVRDSVVVATLPADGTYVAVATRFLEAEGFENGTYYLTVALDESGGPLPQAGETTLSYGQTVGGTIDDTTYEERWTFAGARGDLIDVTMARAEDESGGLDGYLILEGPDGGVLIEADDAGGSVMPALTGFALPADGIYTLVATRFGFANGFSAGEYSLTLVKTGTASVPPPGLEGSSGIRWLTGTALPEGLRRLPYNEPVDGSIDAANLDDWFIFQGRAGDVITLRMTGGGGDLDPFVLLTDEAGYELARADDASTGDLTAEIAGFTLPADAPYLVRATRYGFEHGTTSGAYTLVIESEAEPVGPAADVPAVALDFEQIVTGTLDLNAPVVRYTFAGQAGQWLSVYAEPASGDVVLSLRLLTPGSQVMDVTQSVGSGGAVIRRAMLPSDGPYTLEILLDDFGTSGDFRLIAVGGESAGVDLGAFEPAPGQDIEVVLVWAGESDLALEFTGPESTPAPESASANDFCTALSGISVERAAWAEGTALPGPYAFTVRYAIACTGSTLPVSFTLAVVDQGRVDLIHGTLALEGDSYTTLLDFAP